jgi:uncharacterized protein with LGFP repeats
MTAINVKKIISGSIHSLCIGALCLGASISHAWVYPNDGYITDKWLQQGGVDGWMGAPIGTTARTSSNNGNFNEFPGNGKSTIYHKDGADEAFSIFGYVRAKYEKLNRQNSVLGYPTSDAQDGEDGRGRYHSFEGGYLYFLGGAPAAYEIHGWPLNFWSWAGWERSQLGYPTSDVYSVSVPGGNVKYVDHFENGAIYSNDSSAWPIMTTARGSAGSPWTAISISASYQLTQLAGRHFLSVSGSNFTPGAWVRFYESRQNYAAEVGGTYADANGNVSFNSSLISEYIDTFNNVATVFAREGDGGRVAIYSQFRTGAWFINRSVY